MADAAAVLFLEVPMFAMGNHKRALAEPVQPERWRRGPLELVLLPDTGGRWSQWLREGENVEAVLGVTDWNQSMRGGFVRPAAALNAALTLCPRLRAGDNPNTVLVPDVQGYTELHTMLASLVPAAVLRTHGITKELPVHALSSTAHRDHRRPCIKASFDLVPHTLRASRRPPQLFARAAARAFAEYVWKFLAERPRLRMVDFSRHAPLRVLAHDVPFWMHRVYRIAIDRWEALPEWTDDEIRRAVTNGSAAPSLPEAPCESVEVGPVQLRRPLHGGYLWDTADQEQCDDVLREAVRGAGVLESLEPVLEHLRSHFAHEDFSERNSWVKEDFERAFHSKRSRLKVQLLETVDDAPVWCAEAPEGEGAVLFRDVFAILNPAERRLVIALRHGRTVSEIARQSGYRSHSPISRALRALKRKVRRTLGEL